MDEQEWLDDFQRRVGDMRTKSLLLQGKLSRAEGTAQSGNGLVSVTVTPSGALKNLHIDDRAVRQGGAAQLTAMIMETYGKAQRQVSREVADALEPLAGGSEMMQVVRSFLPPPEEPETPETPEPPPPPPPPAPPRPQTGPSPTPQAAPPRPPRSQPDEDDLQPW
ncbi:YbaB/EbfC family nucleoid-associated protein [Amycolatopsis sp. H20-H5]|uniref:YbaB/EbfC family nucleoid-associated protein n=1 Tax=Amycolatopsis sp. H20-H5 TaxID=3046309 RepID=UPI002DC00250|nr:YbaB/EbfC family nucleoid-associated protein [Amycolatopsis sp. H20-H5]MEC3976156.1 YbaB/EbfC family nucleoid-associated protein [Amycolatopsis sp. H20-H5]